MFGLLYAGIAAICRGIGKAQYDYETYQNRESARSKGKETYLDCYGAERLVSNGKYVFRHNVEYSLHGDYVMEDENGNIIHNYSKNARDKDTRINIELAKLNKNTVYQKGQSNNERCDPNHWRVIYIDFETGKELFVQEISPNLFYRDAITGEYIRRSDEDLRKGTDWSGQFGEEYKPERLMAKANERWNENSLQEKQRMLKQEMGKYHSDLSVPSSRRFKLDYYTKPLYYITQEDYDRVVKEYL